MQITRIIVFPIPTTDRWAIYQVAADSIPIDVDVWPNRDQAVADARKQARFYHCPVITLPEEDA